VADIDYTAIVDAIGSAALASGLFERFNGHEPKSSPGNGITGAVWMRSEQPFRSGSGLSSTTVLMTVTVRVYTSMVQEPADAIDPNLDAAVRALMKAYHGDFTLGGLIRNVDLLGMSGTPLSWQSGYLDVAGKINRIADITVPLIVNDVYDQAP